MIKKISVFIFLICQGSSSLWCGSISPAEVCLFQLRTVYDLIGLFEDWNQYDISIMKNCNPNEAKDKVVRMEDYFQLRNIIITSEGYLLRPSRDTLRLQSVKEGVYSTKKFLYLCNGPEIISFTQKNELSKLNIKVLENRLYDLNCDEIYEVVKIKLTREPRNSLSSFIVARKESEGIVSYILTDTFVFCSFDISIDYAEANSISVFDNVNTLVSDRTKIFNFKLVANFREGNDVEIPGSDHWFSLNSFSDLFLNVGDLIIPCKSIENTELFGTLYSPLFVRLDENNNSPNLYRSFYSEIEKIRQVGTFQDNDLLNLYPTESDHDFQKVSYKGITKNATFLMGGKFLFILDNQHFLVQSYLD